VSEEERKTYRGLFVTNFIIALGFGIADPFFPVYAVHAGATPFHIALIFSTYAVAKTLMSPLVGWCSDRRGRRNLIITGLCTYLVVSLYYLSMPGPLALIVLRTVQGIGAALVRPVSLAFVGDIAPARREAETMGTFDISFYGAVAIGPIIGGCIKDAVGFFGVFLSLTILCFLSLVAALIFVITLPDTRKGLGEERPRPTNLRAGRHLIGLSGFIFTRSFGIVLCAIFLPIFMDKILKLTGLQMGIIMGTATAVTALLLKPMGCLSDKLNHRWLVIVGGSMTAFLTFCLPIAQTFGQLLTLSIGIGLFSVISLPASSALLVKEGNLYGMGLAMGIFNGAMSLGTVLAPLAGGLALGFFGINAIFYWGGFLGVIGIAFFCFCSCPVRAQHEERETLLAFRGNAE
jgi:MFS family permease